MADITMCDGVNADKNKCCKMKGCHRFTAPKAKYQSFFMNAPFITIDGIWECEYYCDREGN